MTKKQKKLYVQKKRRYLKKLTGNSEQPRLCVFRSNKHIYAQLIDDNLGHTLVASSTLTTKNEKFSPKEFAFWVGENLGQKAKTKKIEIVVFDRGKRSYHGRIASLADGARKAGLIF